MSLTVRDDRFWAAFLGIEPADWGAPGVSYRVHVGLRDYRGLWCFRRNDRIVVSAPRGWIAALEERFAGCDPDDLMRTAFLTKALADDCEQAIGPAFQGCLDPERFTRRAAPRVRKLVAADAGALDALRAACGPDWDAGGFDKTDAWRYGYFDDEGITAVAGYRTWTGDAGDPCILTHPRFRGAGRSAAVTGAVVSDALANGKLLLYQTLESNEAAVRVAFALGFERYANHVAVRLRSDAARW
jgi:hypothetical protein